MLGDNSEKSKNPLKKAMRRRNAKSVSFSNPTYIEASDVEFGTDDEMEDGDFFDHDEESSRGDDDEESQDGQHEDIVVEPLKTKAQREKESEESEGMQAETQDSDHASPEKSRTSEDVESEGAKHRPFIEPYGLLTLAVENVSRSRNGTVRNTDSFFKDDTAETKKISLTPNLLRDEGGNSIVSNELKEVGIPFVYFYGIGSDVFSNHRVAVASRRSTRPLVRLIRAKMTRNERTRSQECSVGYSSGRTRSLGQPMTKGRMGKNTPWSRPDRRLLQNRRWSQCPKTTRLPRARARSHRSPLVGCKNNLQRSCLLPRTWELHHRTRPRIMTTLTRAYHSDVWHPTKPIPPLQLLARRSHHPPPRRIRSKTQSLLSLAP